MDDQTILKQMSELSAQMTDVQKFMIEISDKLNKERPIIGNGFAYKVVEKVDMLNDSMQKLIVLEE